MAEIVTTSAKLISFLSYTLSDDGDYTREERDRTVGGKEAEKKGGEGRERGRRRRDKEDGLEGVRIRGSFCPATGNMTYLTLDVGNTQSYLHIRRDGSQNSLVHHSILHLNFNNTPLCMCMGICAHVCT